MTTLQLLPSLFSLPLIVAAILAEHEDCYKKRTVHSNANREERALVYSEYGYKHTGSALESMTEAVHGCRDGHITQLKHLIFLCSHTGTCFKLANRLATAANHVG